LLVKKHLVAPGRSFGFRKMRFFFSRRGSFPGISVVVKNWDRLLSSKGLGYFPRSANTGTKSAVTAGVIAHGCGFTGEEQTLLERAG